MLAAAMAFFAVRCESCMIRCGVRTSGRSPARGEPSTPSTSSFDFCYTDRESGVKIGYVCIIWVAGDMFTIGFRGCDFHEKDACGPVTSSLTGSMASAGSSHAVPALNVTF